MEPITHSSHEEGGREGRRAELVNERDASSSGSTSSRSMRRGGSSGSFPSFGIRVLYLPLVLSSILFIHGAFGSIGPEFDRLAGLCGLVVLLLFAGSSSLALAASMKSRRVQLGFGLVAVGMAVLVLADRRNAWLFGAAAALCGLGMVWSASGNAAVARLAKAAALGAFAFAAWYQCTRLQAVPWKVEDDVVGAVVAVFTSAVGAPLSMGATYSGFAIPLLASMLVLTSSGDAGLLRRTRLWFALVPWILFALLLACAGHLAYGRWPIGHADPIGIVHLVMLRIQPLAQVLWLAAVSLAVTRSAPPSVSVAVAPERRRRLGRRMVWAGSTAAVLVAANEWRHEAVIADASPARLIAVTDSSVDAFTQGHYYGKFHDLARDLGFATVWTHSYAQVDPPAGPGDVVALLFPVAWSAQNEAEPLLAAVERGAGLFVVGEHTNAADTADLLRPVLSPLGFRVGFDSVFPAGWPWSRCLALHDHATAPPWRTSLNSRYLVGASVEPPWLGHVAVDARYAFGDVGNPNGIPGNQIGDRVYSPTDRLGDLPVIASRSYGRGRALVVGDPNLLHDTSLAWSRSIVARMLTYLAGPPASPGFDLVVQWLACLLLVLASIAALGRPDVVPWPSALLAVTLLLGDVCGEPDPGDVPSPAGRFVIDVAHHPDISFEEKGRRSVLGLVEKLQSDGRDVVFSTARGRADLHGAAGLITIAPHSPIPAVEAAEILRFVQDGGTWVVAAGVQHAPNVTSILDAAGVDIQPVLLGTAMAWRGDPAIEATEGLFREAYALRLRPGSTARALHVAEAPLITETRLGNGRIVVIGDPLFLLGGNLGGTGYDIAANQLILHKVLHSS